MSAFITPILNYRRQKRTKYETVDEDNHECNTVTVRMPTSKGDEDYDPGTVRRYWLKFLTTQIHTTIPYMTNPEHYKQIKSCFVIENKHPHSVYDFAMGLLASLISKTFFFQMATYISSESLGSKLYPNVITLDTVHLIYSSSSSTEEKKQTGSPHSSSFSISSVEDVVSTTPNQEMDDIRKLFRLPKGVTVKKRHRIPEKGNFKGEMHHIIPIPSAEGKNG